MIDGHNGLEDALMGCDADIPTVFLMPSSDAQAVEPILELRNAIIIRAVNDYLMAFPGGSQELYLRGFFRSEWCNTLLSMDEAVNLIDIDNLLELLDERKRRGKAETRGRKPIY